MNAPTLTDPRRDLTSASSAEADTLCPGRFMAQRGLPDEPNEYAEIGTRVHFAMAGEPVALSDDEAEIVERAREIETRVFEAWFLGPIPPDFKAVRERRIWTTGSTMRRLHSGQLDAYWLDANGRALIEEIKSLFGDVTQSPSNLQLRDQAALLWEQEGVTEVTVFVNQPLVTGRPLLVTYTEDDLQRAHAQMVARALLSQSDGQPRFPGDKQCSHCRARLTCPEALGTVKQLATLYTREIEPEEMLPLLEIVGAAKKVIAALETRARRLLEENPDVLPGWMLEEGARRRTITDPQLAYTKVSTVLTPEQFAACCTVKISELEKLFKKLLGERTGLKPKDCLVQFTDLLTSAIEVKQNAPSLARAKGAQPAPLLELSAT